jgi:hypothetical protein
MSGRDSVQSLLALRKLTRAIGEVVRGQMTEYLAALTPLLRPKAVLGDYIQGVQKDPHHKTEKLYKDLQALYEKVAPAKPFSLTRELTPPFNLAGVGLEITPFDYTHLAQSGAETRRITVRSPLTWVLTYTGFAPTRLPELLDTRVRSSDELQRFIVSHLVMHLATTSQPAVLRVFDALHFPITSRKTPDFGELPLTLISLAAATVRPADPVVIQSAELTGMDAFEEVVNPDDVAALRDPLRERLLQIAREHVPELA